MEDLRALVAIGLVLPLILLRLQAEEFGAAEYDEVYEGEKVRFTRRIAWYVIGVAIIVAIYNIHPSPRDTLNLVTGRRVDALVFGMGFALVGVAQAIIFALVRYGDLRLPAARAYPDAALNTIGTAFIDEVTFRGIVLGMLTAAGVNETFAILIQAILYALATRTGAKGRHPYMLLVTLFIGLAGGWVTVRTGGIGAAFFGDAVTRFSLFVCTGHAGRVLRRGEEVEDAVWFHRAPKGWRDARLDANRGAEPRGVAGAGDAAAEVQPSAAASEAANAAAREAASAAAATAATGHLSARTMASGGRSPRGSGGGSTPSGGGEPPA